MAALVVEAARPRDLLSCLELCSLSNSYLRFERFSFFLVFSFVCDCAHVEYFTPNEPIFYVKFA